MSEFQEKSNGNPTERGDTGENLRQDDNENKETISQRNDEQIPAKHGVGDRRVYYDKWEEFARTGVAEIEEEEKLIKAKEAEALAQIPLSEAEKKDREKRQALKEAKKHWDGVTANENAQKIVISNEKEIQNKVFHFENDLQSRRVLVLKDNTDCSYVLPSNLSLIKIFVEGCQRCSIIFNCNVATSTIEFSRCEDLNVSIQAHPIHTLQVDLCERVKITYADGLFTADSRVYHSAVRNIRIEYLTSPEMKYQELDDYQLSELSATLLQSDELSNTSQFSGSYAHHFGTSHLSSNQKQFVTSFSSESNDLITDLVLRDAGGHITTIREIEERKKAVEKAVREKGLDINSEEVQKILHEYDPPSPQEQASKLKEKGNVAFKECDYAQASLFYSQAIEILENIVSETFQTKEDDEVLQKLHDECKEVLCTIYSNRAACALKLGDHELALSDSNSCLEFDPENVKANFRKGLALHALGRYREACPVLGLALKREPKNQQIKSALLFAERKAAMPNSK